MRSYTLACLFTVVWGWSTVPTRFRHLHVLELKINTGSSLQLNDSSEKSLFTNLIRLKRGSHLAKRTETLPNRCFLGGKQREQTVWLHQADVSIHKPSTPKCWSLQTEAPQNPSVPIKLVTEAVIWSVERLTSESLFTVWMKLNDFLKKLLPPTEFALAFVHRGPPSTRTTSRRHLIQFAMPHLRSHLPTEASLSVYLLSPHSN